MMMKNKLLIIFLLCNLLLSSCVGFQVRYDHSTLTPSQPQPAATFISTPASFPNFVDKQSQLFTNLWNDTAPFTVDLNPDEIGILTKYNSFPRYRIDVEIDQELRKIDATQEVLFTNNEAQELNEIVFRVYTALFGANVAWKDVQVNGEAAQYTLSEAGTVLDISLKTALAPDEAIVVSLSYAYEIPLDADANYNIFASADGLLTLAHFYPILAVFDGKGWHRETPPNYGDVTYSDAAFYMVRIHAPQDVVLVTSGEQIDHQLDADEQVTVFAAGPARDFMICAGYDLVEDTLDVDGVAVRSFTPADLTTGRKAALSAAAAALKSFSQILGPYPYREFDVIATHTNALGVEYPGLTTINQQIYHLDQKTDGTPYNILLESVIAHEAAHQWLYNLVGNDQVNAPWLDESLTQYATYRYYADQYGSEAANGYLQDFYNRWDRVDRAKIPIGKPVAFYEDGSYSAIVYGRGALFFYELEKIYGREMMDDFLHEYTKKFSWDVVTSQEMKDSLEAACHCSLDEAFKEWVE